MDLKLSLFNSAGKPNTFSRLTGFPLCGNKNIHKFYIRRMCINRSITHLHQMRIKKGLIFQIHIGQRSFILIHPADVIFQPYPFTFYKVSDITFHFFCQMSFLFMTGIPGFRCVDSDKPDFGTFFTTIVDPKGIAVYDFGDIIKALYSFLFLFNFPGITRLVSYFICLKMPVRALASRVLGDTKKDEKFY